MAVSLEQFSKQLDDSGVMTDADIKAFIEALPADAKPTDGEQLAKRLVRDKKISAYQAQVVYSGKGKSLTLGSYSVVDKLGQGGMGMVLKAEHRVMKRLVALKVLSPAVTKTKDSVLRFQREVEAAARLTHPNIVAAFDAGEANGTSFLVMEYVPGTDLSSLVKDKGPLPVHQAIDCIIQAARGLEFAHANGVIHRDIKPANLLLDTSGSVKILDMGLARIQADDAATQAELTGTGAVMGTVDYMAPEQALSTKHANAKSDIYSLGISLWYLLTGKSTYEGDSLMARLLAHRDQPIPSLREARAEVSEELEAVFRRMVAKKPAERYQTATEVIADLQACRTGGSVSAMVMVEEEVSSVDDFKAFLQGIEGTTSFQGGAKSKTSYSATQTLSKSSLTRLDETIPAPGKSDTLRARRKQKDQPKSSPWFQDLRVLIGGGAAAVLLLLAMLLLFQNPNGTLRVEIRDPEVEVTIQGTKVTLRGADAEPVSLKAGEKKLLVTRGRVALETEAFVLKRGSETTVTVDLVANTLVVKNEDRILGEKSLPRMNVTSSTTDENSGGTATGSALASKAPGGYALKFEPPDSYVDIPAPTKPESAECTCELWFTPNGYIPNSTTFYLLTGPYGELTIADDKFRFYTFHGHALSPTLYKQNQRVHLAGVNDTNRRLLYLNGKLIATTDDAGHPNPSNDPQPMRIGGDRFAGLIDAVRVSRVARYQKNFIPPVRFSSDKDTIALYRFDEGQGDVLKDSSGNNHHGKIISAKWAHADGSTITSQPVTPPTVVYLDDLQETSWKDGHMQLGKHNLEYNGWKYTWRGKEPAHALVTHPVPNKTASVSYQLGGQYETFTAVTGIADVTEVGSKNPLMLRVLGDGRELWKSPPLQKLTDEAAISVSVKGINELKLEVSCGDDNYKALAVWFEPRLTRLGAGTSPDGEMPPLAKAPFDSVQARAHQEQWAKHLGTTAESTNSIGMTMTLIPPGEFLMGCSDADHAELAKTQPEGERFVRVFANERPQHRVQITQPFAVGKYEVTRGEFRQFVDETKYVTEVERPAADGKSGKERAKSWQDDHGFPYSDRHPVMMVTWNDAVAFCEWLSKKEGMRYTLPTEAQAEYICRAGTQDNWAGTEATLAERAWSRTPSPREVGLKAPNPFGLHDIQGNVIEWCLDGHVPYTAEDAINPQAASTGPYRIVRGGNIRVPASHLRPGKRGWITSTSHTVDVGFRVVKVLEAEQKISNNSTGSATTSVSVLTSPDYRWTEPENLGPDVNGTHYDEHPELMSDGLRMWFSGGGEIWMSTRPTLNSPFGKRVNVGQQINDGASWDSEPTLSQDRLSLVFSSDRGTDTRDVNLWMCSKATFGEPFGKPIKLGNDVNSSDWETCPALSADGLTLLFSSSRPGGEGDFDLWQATRADTASEFGNVTNLGPVVNSRQRDSGAYLSSDGLVLLFESTRGGAGKNDLYLSTRPARDAAFGTPVSLGNSVNSSDDEQGPCLSADGRTLKFYSNRPGGHGEVDLWMSRRVPK